jgi:hypothetical protein
MLELTRKTNVFGLADAGYCVIDVHLYDRGWLDHSNCKSSVSHSMYLSCRTTKRIVQSHKSAGSFTVFLMRAKDRHCTCALH